MASCCLTASRERPSSCSTTSYCKEIIFAFRRKFGLTSPPPSVSHWRLLSSACFELCCLIMCLSHHPNCRGMAKSGSLSKSACLTITRVFKKQHRGQVASHRDGDEVGPRVHTYTHTHIHTYTHTHNTQHTYVFCCVCISSCVL